MFCLSVELSQEDRKGCLSTFDCYGILGIVNLVGFNFLVTVDSRGQSPAAVLYNDINVFEVQQIKLTPFHRDMNLEANPRLSIQYESFLKLFNGNGIGSGFYFSYHADLTMSLQEQHRRREAKQPYTSNLMRKNEFIWNYEILRDFLMHGISHRWIVPVIQGYVASDH